MNGTDTEKKLVPTIMILTDGINKDDTDAFKLEVRPAENMELDDRDVVMLLLYAAADAANVTDADYYPTIDRLIQAIYPDVKYEKIIGDEDDGEDIPY